MDSVCITVRLTPEFDRHLRIEAARRDMNRSDFIRQILSEAIGGPPPIEVGRRGRPRKEEHADESPA